MQQQNNPEKTPVLIAVSALEATKREITERYKRDIEEIDRVIAEVKKLSKKKSGWGGMGIPDAVHAFLSDYNKPVKFKVLMSGLQERGVRLGDPTKPNRFQANVKTTVINNKRFSYNKRKDTVRLVMARPSSTLISAAG